MKPRAKDLSLADLIYSITHYLMQDEYEDYKQNPCDHHVYNHCQELIDRTESLKHKLLSEFDETDWEQELIESERDKKNES